VIPIRGPRTISGSSSRCAQLEGRLVERETVVLPRDRERLAETSRPGAEQAILGDAATPPHRVEPVQRLERADQHGVRHVDVLADEVQAPVDRRTSGRRTRAGRAEHRRVPRGPAAEAVRGGILVVVRLDLDDRPADAVAEQRRPISSGATSCTDRAKKSRRARHASLSRFES
jgi:hypothetical protein